MINEYIKSIQFSSLQHFATTTMAPLFEVGEVYHNPEHPAHALLLFDLASIPEQVVEWFMTESDIRHLVTRRDDVMEQKVLIFTSLVSDEIDNLRKLELCSSNSRPKPYDHTELQEVALDRNMMVKCDDMQMRLGGYTKGEEMFVMLPCTNATNSSYWLQDAINSIRRPDLLKIRLDPLIHEPVATFNPMMYKMQLYGTAFEWERIKNLTVLEQTQFVAEFPSSRDISRTDLIWKPIDDEIHFTCEEMPHKTAISGRGSLYFHAIFQKESGRLKHCDGAIRFYNEEEYDFRMEKHIKENEVTRVGTRVKVFQFDVPETELSTEPITHKQFMDLVTTFFVWNHDVLGYFNPSLS